MISSVEEFEEDSYFELYLLEHLYPVIDEKEKTSIDLRDTISRVHISCFVDTHESSNKKILNRIEPLIFGASWKLLDFIVELALSNASIDSGPQDLKIFRKQNYARNTLKEFSLLSLSMELWSAICDLYVNTVELRHCLTHRAAIVNLATGSFSGFDRSGAPLQPMVRDELIAFAKATALIARGVISGYIDKRSERHLKYYMNRLVSHTCSELFMDCSCSAPVEIRASLIQDDEKYYLDFPKILEKVRKSLPAETDFNLILDVPGESGRKLFAVSEDCPPEKVLIDLTLLPSWLTLM